MIHDDIANLKYMMQVWPCCQEKLEAQLKAAQDQLAALAANKRDPPQNLDGNPKRLRVCPPHGPSPNGTPPNEAEPEDSKAVFFFHLTFESIFEQCVIHVCFESFFQPCCPFNAELNVRQADVRGEPIPQTPAAKAARLRRVCELKPSGKLKCPQWLHEQWKNTASRPQLTKQLEAAGWDKDWIISKSMTHLITCCNTEPVFNFWWNRNCIKSQPFKFALSRGMKYSDFQCSQEAFVKELTVQRERKNQKKLETLKGWYSETDMKDELGWKPTHGSKWK